MGADFDQISLTLRSYRWAHNHQPIYVMRPINTRTNESARKE